MMRRSLSPLVAVAAVALSCLTCLSTPARAQNPTDAGFVVIANIANGVNSLPRIDASKLFLRMRSTWPSGQSAEPMDQVESSPVRRRFSDAIHLMDVPSVKSFWQEKVFSGKGDPPPERASDGEVVAFVKTHPNGLGYVASTTRLEGVKVILVTP